MTNLKLKEQPGELPAEPCDPKRLKVLEHAMREAIQAYLTYTDPHNRISRDEALGRLIEILDRGEVARAAQFDVPDAQAEAPKAAAKRKRAG
jgi:hypothetical protein